MAYTVLVFGSRDLEEGPRSPVWTVLDGLAAIAIPEAPLLVIEGGASGADRAARNWWDNSPAADPEAVNHRAFPADWSGPCVGAPWCWPGHRRHRADGSDYCPSAGHRRNQAMADERPDVAWGFVTKPLAKSRGSLDMAARLEAAGIQSFIVQVWVPDRVLVR